MEGGEGNDTYQFGLHYGHDTINNYDTSKNKQDTLRFLAGISTDDVKVSKSGDDLKLTINANDSVTIKDFFKGANYELQKVAFADGMTWNVHQLTLLANARYGSDIPWGSHAMANHNGASALIGLRRKKYLIGWFKPC